MKLSILIPTHKRPGLFNRCLLSALKHIPKDVEILVNNDSNDIYEVQHDQVKYFYNQFDNLSGVYESLLSNANGEFIYYLEDDDYLTDSFYEVMSYLNGYDIIHGLYYPSWNDNWIAKCAKDEVLQLGQFIMKRELVNQWEYPEDNCIHNDRKLIEFLLSKGARKLLLHKVLYIQTTDGGDNISFPESTNYYGTT
jgi:glycosyltransferase involved in cell wall biosynthesis